MNLFIALLAAITISGVAWRAKALSRSGAGAAAMIGFLVFGLGGAVCAVALLLFFVTSTALSRVGKARKAALAYEKGGQRDAGQVLANGGVAALCAVLVWCLPPDWVWPRVAVLGALASANADTWATEIGSLAARPPRLLTTLRPAPVGASGAVSGPGTLAALGGAALVALVAVWSPGDARSFLAVAGGGFAGALFDSLLGASLQVQYRCPVCGKLTERRVHCDGAVTEWARGLPWMNNDVVNVLATLCGALLAGLLAPRG